MIQTIIFDKKYFTIPQAIKWMQQNKESDALFGTKNISKIHETKNFIRFRQREVRKDMIYYTVKSKTKGVKYILYYPRY
jgi:hypothetical protein